MLLQMADNLFLCLPSFVLIALSRAHRLIKGSVYNGYGREANRVTYYWRRLDDSPFVMCFVLDERDARAAVLSDANGPRFESCSLFAIVCSGLTDRCLPSVCVLRL